MNDKVLSIIIKAQDQASSVFKSLDANLTNTGRNLTRYVSLPLAGVAVASLKMAGDFEQSLNVLQSVTGATSKQMSVLQDEAKALGNDMTLPGISAKDAAGAMTELAKAGLSVNDVMAASKGVLSLAKAGQIDVSDAAMTTARALNAFQLSGDQANKIADLLAASANASTASVSDMALGLQMAGAQSHQMGISLQDTVTALAMFSNAGINGSDAGTSLKQMFIQLATPTTQASKLMKSLSLDFFDAKGNFIGLANMSQMLQDKLKDLTVEQKNSALATIFGSDATRVASILAQNGAAGFNSMSDAVNKQGAAANLAAAQNKGFNGALDNLKSTAETAMIEIGTKLLPIVTRELKKFADGIASVTTWFDNLSPGQQDFIFKVGEILIVVGPAILILGKFAQAFGAISTVVMATSRALGLFSTATVVSEAARATGAIGKVGGLAGAAGEATGAIAGGGGLLAALGPIGVALAATAVVAGGAYLAYKAFANAGNDAIGATKGLYMPVSLLTLAQDAQKKATDDVAQATESLKAKQDAHKQTIDSIKLSNDNLRAAQDSVKAALDAFGQNSPQYQAAVGNLRDVEDDYNTKLLREWGLSQDVRNAEGELKNMRGELTGATGALKEIQDRLNGGLDSGNKIIAQFGPNAFAQVGAIDVLQAHIGLVVSAWNGWNGQLQSQLPNMVGQLQGLGSNISRLQNQGSNLVGTLQNASALQVSVGSGLQGGAAGLQGGATHRASGGPVKMGQTYIVGEHEPELFVPNQSGTIMNQQQLHDAGVGATTFNMFGNIQLGSANAVDRFFEKFNGMREMASLGAGV